MGIDHYENFPVASILLPPALRAPIAAIYVFARSADDIADEGAAPPEERLQQLAHYREQMNRLATGTEPLDPLFARLAPHIATHRLPISLFTDLLDAFAQDVHQDRYASYGDLLDYCRRSANPVGRLLLHLFGAATPENLVRSDAICSALQLINHWQDVAIDLGKGPRGRIYLPQEDLQRFGIDDAALHCRLASADFRKLMQFQVERAGALMRAGASLGWDLPGRIGLEIRAIVAGGLRILAKLKAVDYDVFQRRPTLTAFDAPRLLWPVLVRPL